MMKNNNIVSMYLGIDIGASYCKAVLIDSGEKVYRSQRVKMPSFLHDGSQSYLTYEIDVQKITDVVFELIKRVVTDLNEPIEAIGIAGQMHGILLVDESNEPLSNFISWQDKRTEEQILYGKEVSYLDYLKEQLKEYRSVTGTDIRSGMLGPVLFWFKKNGYLEQKYVKATFLSDYFASLLSNTDPVCDPTNAAGSGIYNLLDNNWVDSFFDVTKISKENLPKIVKSGTKIGEISNFIAQKLGIKQGTPVYVSIGDYQATLFASAIDTKSISINIGTGAQVSILTKDPKYTKSFENRPFFDGYFTNCISGLSGGRAISLFEEFVSNTIALFTGSSAQFEILNKLDKLCVNKSMKADIICVPQFFKHKDSLQKTGFYNIGSPNFRIEEFYYALVYGIVNEYFNAFNILNSGNILKDSYNIILSGGVGRKSKLVQKIINDYFGLDIVIPEYDEEAAVGAALIAKKYNCRG